MTLCAGQAVPTGRLFSDCLALKMRALWPFEVLGNIHLEQRFPTCAPRSPKGSGLRVHFPGAPRPLQENKINKN